MTPSYAMTPAPIPKRGGRRAKNVYEDALDEFLAQTAESVTITFEKRKDATVVLGMRRAIKAAGAPVFVIQRGGAIYLQKSS